MAAKKVGGLRIAWPGDAFHVGALRFDQDGSWEHESGKPVTFTEAETLELIELGKANKVALVPLEDPEQPDAGTPDTPPTT